MTTTSHFFATLFFLLSLCSASPTFATVKKEKGNTNSRELNESSELSPVVLFPGFALSQLEGKLSYVPSPPYPFCPRTTFNYFLPIWFSLILLVIPGCVPYYFSLDIDEEASQLLAQETGNPNAIVQRDAEGVTIRPRDFGNLQSARFFDTRGTLRSLDSLSTFLEVRGYVANVNLFGAPIDWRLTTSDLQRRGTFDDIKNLVESAYEGNNQTKVSFIAVSHGGVVSLKFLQSMTQAWKDKYMSAYIPISTPFGGIVYTISFITTGKISSFLDSSTDFLDDSPLQPLVGVIKFVVPTFVRPMFRTFGSVTDIIFPRSEVFESFGAIVETPSKSYGTNDMFEMFSDLGLTEQARLYNFSQSDPIVLMDAPMVNTHIIYGFNISTPKKLVYTQDFQPNKVPKNQRTENGDGDGLVNLESLSFVEEMWEAAHNSSGFETTVLRVENGGHGNTANASVTFDKIADILHL